MMKQEFEELAGYEVSENDYRKIIEPMYMATSLSKADFVNTISKKRFALRPTSEIIKEMRGIAEYIKATCIHYTDYEKKNKIEDLAREYIGRKYNISGSKIVSFGIHEEMAQTCYYPKSVEIFGTRTYKTVESIVLIKEV